MAERHTYRVTNSDGRTQRVRGDWGWVAAVYPAAEGWTIALDDPCSCTQGRVCDSCYGKAYANLYSR